MSLAEFIWGCLLIVLGITFAVFISALILLLIDCMSRGERDG